jgi:two-component system, OmpR family, sensor kinase
MPRLSSFHRFISSLPIRWRLALVSFGLLAVLLTALGIFISSTEESTLLASQANILNNEGHIAQLQLEPRKVVLTASQLPDLPTMSKSTALSMLSAVHNTLGQHVNVSFLSFDGSVLATDGGKLSGSKNPGAPTVALDRLSIEQWLTGKSHSSYLLANDDQGQRELVILQPFAGIEKSAETTTTQTDLSMYRKALLQLSVPTIAIDQSVTTMRLILTLGILAALSIAAALTLPLINVALHPLVEMEKVSAHIAAGALSLRLEEPPAQDEIGRLARAFNSMVARLEAAFTRQKRFVADVSHELRTPLTGLGGSLEMLLLRADEGDEATARLLMRGMYAEVGRMQRLVADLLALTRLDEGRIKLYIEAVEVAPLLKEVCEQVQGLLQGQELCIRVPPDLPALCGDADQLRRVLLNIVENALKFTPPGGRVELVVYKDCPEFVTLEVRDTGAGIPPQDLSHVFDRFYRADSSRTRLFSQGGSGLGLSIAKELVEAHGGTITIKSLVGEGTTVTIRLPAM